MPSDKKKKMIKTGIISKVISSLLVLIVLTACGSGSDKVSRDGAGGNENGKAYITNNGSDNISIVDLSSNCQWSSKNVPVSVIEKCTTWKPSSLFSTSSAI